MTADPRRALRLSKGKVFLAIGVQPRSRKSALAGLRNDALLVQVTAAPVEGAANQAVIEVLAKTFSLHKSTFILHQGVKSRDKIVQVENMEAPQLCRLLEMHFGTSGSDLS